MGAASVMVVSGNPRNAELMAQRLAAGGFDVRVGGSPAEFAGTCAVAVLDAAGLGETGRQWCACLNARHVPVVLIAGPAWAAAADRLGARAVLNKPVEPKRLLTLCRALATEAS